MTKLARRTRLMLVGVALAVALAAGWLIYPHDCLVAGSEVEVVAEPSPAGYPSTKPQPNRVVERLSPGQRVRIWYTGYGKDFAYYKVRLPGGTWGYVISGSKARVMKNCR
jgi:hypothetical protein